jgi:hypothetical protein
MNHEIGAEGQRTSQHRRRRGAVDGEQRAGGMGDLRGAGHVDHRSQRVRRDLDPQKAGSAWTYGAARRAMGIAKVTLMPEASAKFLNQLRSLQCMTCGAAI